MKIILCAFLLCITAVSVFGKPQELNRIVGESIEFPAAVKKGGYLMYGGVTIGDSSRGPPGIGNYRGRLDWDSSTGFFSLSGLKLEDIGEYKVHNTDENINVFQLNLYKDNVPVSKPHVSITHNEFPCTLLCAVERGTGVTLSWYREDQKKPYVTSPVESAPGLHLPVPVESGTYSCEAKNSVSNEKASITVGAHCTAPSGFSTGIIVASSVFVAAILIALQAIVFVWCWRNRSKHSTKEGDALQPVPQSGDAVQPVPQSGDALQPVPQSGDAVQPVPQSGNRSKHSTKEGQPQRAYSSVS